MAISGEFLELISFAYYLPVLLRVWVGANFLIHGYPLLTKNAKGEAQRMATEGIPKGVTYASIILLFFGGIFLIIGLIVPVVALLFAILMSGIVIRNMKKKQSYIGGPGKPSYELHVLYILLCIALLVLGAGPFSVDSLLRI